MSTKLYVGNLSFRVTSEDLQEYFAAAGEVNSANVVMDRETGRSRGFGFVEMASEDAANSASGNCQPNKVAPPAAVSSEFIASFSAACVMAREAD